MKSVGYHCRGTIEGNHARCDSAQFRSSATRRNNNGAAARTILGMRGDKAWSWQLPRLNRSMQQRKETSWSPGSECNKVMKCNSFILIFH